MSDRSSAESADSTSASSGQDTGTSSSASPTPGDEKSSERTGPESPSTRTFAMSENQRGEIVLTDVAHQLTSGGGKPGQGYSAVAFLAKMSPSPESGQALPESAPDSSMSSHESLELFDPDFYSSRMYRGSSPRMAVGTSESYLERWPTSGTAWAGGLSTHVSSECRSDEGGCSSSEPSLQEILVPPPSVPARYSLSARAARGILSRAQKRGKALPDHLAHALRAVAGEEPATTSTTTPTSP